MNPNDVVLIYADPTKKDIGVLQDYSFDMCYGDSDNNFECRIQKYNPAAVGDSHIWEDFILYIEFTEYGGIVDRVEVDTNTNEVIYTGRTWHGFLNSFVIEPKKGTSYRSYQGEANAVLTQIISNLGLTSWFQVEDVNSGIKIKRTNVRYERAYDCIMRILTKADAKLVMWYQSTGVTGGKIHIEAVSRVNTGVFGDFDTSQTPFRAGTTYNKVNDLICLGQGSGTKRAVIHLYADSNGGVLPYSRSEPLEDSDYYTDLSALSRSTDPEDIANYAIISASRITGTKRYSLVYDYPNAEITINYKPLSWDDMPSDWAGEYTNYYYKDTENGRTVYKKFEKTYQDKYILTDLYYGKMEPPDWKSKYKEYYVKPKNTSKAFKKVEALPESQSVVKYRPNTQDDGVEGLSWVDEKEWNDYFTKGKTATNTGYYKRVGMQGETYEEVRAEQAISYKLFSDDGDAPFDWNDNYKNYYLRRWNGIEWEYYSVPGEEESHYVLQTKKPDDWDTRYGSYYFKATQKVTKDNKVVIKKGLYYSVSDGIQNGLIDDDHWGPWESDSDGDGERTRTHYDYPKWKKKTFYSLVTTTYTPEYVDGTVYYQVKKLVAPPFESGKYYKKYVDSVPPWKPQEKESSGFGGYYKLLPKVEQIPNPYFVQPYKQVQDRFAELCKAGVQKLEELADTDTLSIDLDLEDGYDIGDIVGAVDEDTGIDVARPILRKIIKIKKDILTVEYEVE